MSIHEFKPNHKFRHEIKQPGYYLELWIDGKLIGEFKTLDLIIGFLAEFYPKCA